MAATAKHAFSWLFNWNFWEIAHATFPLKVSFTNSLKNGISDSLIQNIFLIKLLFNQENGNQYILGCPAINLNLHNLIKTQPALPFNKKLYSLPLLNGYILLSIF